MEIKVCYIYFMLHLILSLYIDHNLKKLVSYPFPNKRVLRTMLKSSLSTPTSASSATWQRGDGPSAVRGLNGGGSLLPHGATSKILTDFTSGLLPPNVNWHNSTLSVSIKANYFIFKIRASKCFYLFLDIKDNDYH